MRKKHYSIDMCSGPIAPKLIRFVIPVLISNVLQLLFNAADVVVVGKFVGDTSQAAVTSTGTAVHLFVGLFSGLSAGSSVMAGQAIGSGERKRIEAVTHTAVLMSLLCGVMLAIAGILLTPGLIRLLGTPESVKMLAILYLQVYFLGVPADLTYNLGAGLLRATGDARRPMYFMIVAGLINVTLNLIFVIGLHWDVAGVAAATAISRYVAAGLVIRCLQQNAESLHLDLRKLAIDPEALRGIVRIGLPTGIYTSMFSLSNFTVQSAINSLGDIAMAGAGAAGSIGVFVQIGSTSFEAGSVTFASQNYGAGKCDRIDRGVRWTLLLSLGTVLVLSALTLGFAPQLLSIYTDNPQVIEQGLLRMRITIPGYTAMILMNGFGGPLRGMGWSVAPMLVSLVCTCGLRLLWVNTVFRAVGTAQCLYLIYPISWIAAGVVLMLCFFLKRKTLYARAEELVRQRVLQSKE